MKIAFIGRAGSGKTSAALYLYARYCFVKCSFADALKEEVMNKYQIPAYMLYKTKPPDVRKLLQKYGMDKRKENPKYWIEKLEQRIVRIIKQIREYIDFFGMKGELDIKDFIDQNFVIDDMRFLNEAEWAKKMGFYIVKLVRKGEYEAAGINDETKKHVSENEFEKIEHDYLIESSNYSELFSKIDDLINSISNRKYHDEPLMKKFEEETGKSAVWKGRKTKSYKEWLKKLKSEKDGTD
ncbi:MAG: hypothetical protein ACTSQ8_09365 [Candidatus Helarchaeota archaeon]